MGEEMQAQKARQQVGNWLLIGVIMTIVQIALGGITRLSGSGLSITEWQVITGSLPPMNAAAWMAEFEKYKATPQFQLLNSDFTLGDFKFIYFWEWFHRLWARLLGVVFAVGFIYFLVTKKFSRSMIAPLVILFVLGGLQGAVGWIMVKSGLTGDAIYVRPAKLALHFLFAMLLICYTWWFALRLKVGHHAGIKSPSLKTIAIVIIALISVQLGFGALMAGHRAASVASTWPTINGYLLHPPGLSGKGKGLLNYIENPLAIHFVHRNLAYLLFFLVIWFALKLKREAAVGSFAFKTANTLLTTVILQVLLGILTLLSSKNIIPNQWGGFEWLALLHQLGGMLLLLTMVAAYYTTRQRSSNTTAL